MGFSLTIEEGKDQGREFTFNQPEISIGRTAENDVVLYDAGVSRKHVTIREEAGRYTVQDLGSANGTKVNGNPITEEEVRDGDTISVGPVVFAFVAIKAEGDGSTKIFDPAEIEKKMQATKAARDKAAKQAGGQKHAVTSMQPALAKSGVRKPGAAPGRPGSGVPVVAPSGGPAKKGAAAAPQAVAAASARARAHREAKTPLAKAKLWWSEASRNARIGAAGGAGVASLLLLFGVVKLGKAIFPNVDIGLDGDHSKEKFALSVDPSKECYGLGDGVTYQTEDKLQMTFNFPVTGKKATATLHFTASGVAKSEEVEVAANAVHMGFVERTFGDEAKVQEIALNPKQLKPNDSNTLVFDNLRNPPNHEPWVICKAWIEVTQLPDAPPAELKNDAKHYIELADRLWDSRALAAPNTYQAWQDYKKARQFLEALDEKVDDLDIVRQRIRDAEHELTEKCSHIMLQGAAAEKTGKVDDALRDYKYGLLWFPEKEHACYRQLEDKIAALE